MATYSTALNYSWENQSLWNPNWKYLGPMDTGDMFVYRPDEVTYDVDLGALGYHVKGEVYAKFAFGLQPYIVGPNAGVFSAEVELSADVNLPGAINYTETKTIDFTVAEFQAVSASIESDGFSNSTGAGLNLIFEVVSGIRNGSYDLPFVGAEKFEDINLTNWTDPITLIDLKPGMSLEYDFLEVMSISAQIPGGIELEGESHGSLRVEADGQSEDPFIGLSMDLDAALGYIARTFFPPLVPKIELLEKTVFLDLEYDLADYVSGFDKGDVGLNVTMLDISANAGIHLTQEISLDLTGQTNPEVPDIQVTLTSDNGTVDTSDDITSKQMTLAELMNGGALSVAAPTEGFGLVTIKAEYQLNRATFSNALGVGLSASFDVTALSASLSAFGYVAEFGPLIEKSYPEDLSFKAFDFFNRAYNAASNTETVVVEYQVFYAPDIAVGANTSDPGAILNAYNAHKRIEHREGVIQKVEGLWDNDPGRNPIDLDNKKSAYFNTQRNGETWLWHGANDIDVSQSRDGAPKSNFLVVAPQNDSKSALWANVVDSSLTNKGSVSPWADSQETHKSFLDLVDTRNKTYALVYKLVDPSGPTEKKTITSVLDTSVVGTARSDLVIHRDMSVGSGKVFYDGGNDTFDPHVTNGKLTGSQAGTGGDNGDVLVANFAASHPGAAVKWNINQANLATGDGRYVTVVKGVTVGNFETVVMRTGAKADEIVLHWGSNYLDTGAGDDYVRVPFSLRSNEILLGDGDDFIEIGSVQDTNLTIERTQTVERQSVIDGGAGLDHALLNAVDIVDLKPRDKVQANVRFNFDGVYNDTRDIYRFAVYSDSGLDMLDKALQLSSDAGWYSGIDYEVSMDISGNRHLYQWWNFKESVEHVGYVGSDKWADVAYFNGAHLYRGGDGKHLDLLIGDFGAVAAASGLDALGKPYGLRMGENGGTMVFGTGEHQSVIEGFERLAVRGTKYADVITGGKGQDIIDGADGNDILDGGLDKQIDFIRGGAGDDAIIWTDSGNDIVTGGDGTDTLFIYAGASTKGGLAYFTALREFDPYFSLQELMPLLDPDVEIVKAGFIAGSTVSFSGIEKVVAIGSDDYDDLLLYQGGSHYNGGERAGDKDIFVANFTGQKIGIDLFLTDEKSAPVTLYPAPPPQVGTASEEGEPHSLALANGVVLTGIDQVLMRGTDADDSFHGASLDDWFDGGLGNDTLFTSGGNDTLLGGAGDDSIFWTESTVGDSSSPDILDGGEGKDTLTVGGANGPLKLAVSNGTTTHSTFSGDLSLTALLDMALFIPHATAMRIGTSTDSAKISNFESYNIAGSAQHNDTIFILGAGLYSGGESAGDADRLVGDLSHVTEKMVADTTAADGTKVSFGSQYHVHGFEHYVLMLGSGDDRIITGDGADFLDGGKGNDFLHSIDDGTTHSEADVLLGGEGNDTISFAGASAHLEGGAGNDHLMLDIRTMSTGGAVQTKVGSWGGNAADLSGNYAEIKEFYTALGSADVVAWLGSDGQSIITKQFETMDLTVDFDGKSSTGIVLAATSGKSTLTGWVGDDVLASQAGEDILIGGKGKDTYVFGTGSGSDTIAGEDVNGAVLVFIGSTKAEVTPTRLGDDLVLTHKGGNVTILGYFAAGLENGLAFDIMTSDSQVPTRLGLTALAGQSNIPDGASARLPSNSGEVVLGTDGADELHGTNGADVLIGGMGDDTFFGSAGRDVFSGGLGSNHVDYSEATEAIGVDLAAGRGNEGIALGDLYISIQGVIGSKTAANQLFGSDLSDMLVGGNANDTLNGGAGNDVLIGGGGADAIDGGAGDDIAYGGAGDDKLYGQNGNDVLGGGAGNDELYGGDNNDVLHGDAGDDLIDGGAGDDRIRYGGADDFETLADENGFDTIKGGAGYDVLDMSRYEFAASMDVQIFGNFKGYTSGTAVAFAPDSGYRQINLGDGIEEFVLTARDDYFNANGYLLRLDMGYGDDVLSVGSDNGGGGFYYGGGGNDTFQFDRKPSLTYGVTFDLREVEGRDHFGRAVPKEMGQVRDGGVTHYVYGFETFKGTDFGDKFTGNDGVNVFVTGLGADRIDMGAGDDRVVSVVKKLNSDTTKWQDVIDGGDGLDTIDYGQSSQDMIIDLNKGKTLFKSFTSTGGPNWSDIIRNFENAVGGSGKDHLIGNDANNVLEGGAGNDLIEGRGGDDWFVAGAGNDRIMGGAGEDTVDYSAIVAPVTVDLKKGIVTVGGKNGWTDTLISIEKVITSSGKDKVIGTSGADTIHYTSQAGNGVDLVNGGAGRDTYDLGTSDHAVAVDLRFFASTISTNGGTNAHSAHPVAAPVASRGAQAGDPATNADTDSEFRDVVVVRSIETFVLTDHDDAFFGSARNDTVAGGYGRDLFTGGDGADLIDGGAGSDTIDYSRETGTTAPPIVVKGYRANGVFVDLSGGILAEDGATAAFDTYGKLDILVSIENVIGTARNDVIVGSVHSNGLQGGAGRDTILGVNGTNLIDAGAGNDLVIGGAGEDYIFGGAGNDRLLGWSGDDKIDGGAGADRMIGGEGDDTYVIDHLKDKIIEAADEGFDTVVVARHFTLANNLEGLQFVGRANFNGTGNAADNRLVGNVGNNTLNGAGGRDTLEGGGGLDILIDADGGDLLSGGAGRDVYVIGGAGTVVIESENGGKDLVKSSVDHTLSDWVEDLRLTGKKAIDGTGNDGDNVISGNAKNNVLDGRGGNDRLFGGAGNDTLVATDGRDTALGGAGNDRILVNLDYAQADGGVGIDTIQFETDYGGVIVDLVAGTVGQTDAMYKGSIYLEGAPGIDWEQALAHADFKGGALPQIEDAGENAFLRDLFNPGWENGFWLGATDFFDEGTFVDLDGRPLDGRYTNWYSGEPNNWDQFGSPGEDWVAMVTDGFWNDIGPTTWFTTMRTVIEYDMAIAELPEGLPVDNTFTGFENAAGTLFDDILLGTDGKNRLEGMGGDDLLRGQGGADVLLGGSGRDTLVGGAGNDVLFGGEDADVFTFAGNFGVDVIRDFALSDGDAIDLVAIGRALGARLSMDDLLLTAQGGDTRIAFDLDRDGTADALDLNGDDVDDIVAIVVKGLAPAGLTGDAFIF